MTNEICKHKFTIEIPVDEMVGAPAIVKLGGLDGLVDRECELCGAVKRVWGADWAVYDAKRTVKICKTCSFYNEVVAKDDDQDYDLGLCCIQHDRLPLWTKDCGCDTFVHGDWADCPTWTTGVTFVGDDKPELIQAQGMTVGKIAPRYLPLGTVICGTNNLSDQFAAVLEFAEKHQSIVDAKMLARAAKHWETDFDQGDEESLIVYNELCDALQSACPPFCFFGSSEANGSDIGVWPNDDEIGEALMEKKDLVRIDHWLDVENVSPTWKFVLVQSPRSDHMELYNRSKGVQGRIWRI